MIGLNLWHAPRRPAAAPGLYVSHAFLSRGGGCHCGARYEFCCLSLGGHASGYPVQRARKLSQRGCRGI